MECARGKCQASRNNSDTQTDKQNIEDTEVMWYVRQKKNSTQVFFIKPKMNKDQNKTKKCKKLIKL